MPQRNLTSSNPAPPSGKTNVVFQLDNSISPQEVSAYVDTVIEDQLDLSDVTTADVDDTRHGLCPKLSGSDLDFLAGDGTWKSPTTGTVTPYDVSSEANLVAYYKLDDASGTTIADSSGNGNTGTTQNSASALNFQAKAVGAPALDKCVNFPSANDATGGTYFTVPRSIQDDFSIECWVRTAGKPPSGGGNFYNGWGLVNAEVVGVVNDFGISIVSSGVIVAGAVSSGSFENYSYLDGRWHHIVWTRVKSSGAEKLFIDALLVDSSTGNSTASLTSPSAIAIGSILVDNNRRLIGDICH